MESPSEAGARSAASKLQESSCLCPHPHPQSGGSEHKQPCLAYSNSHPHAQAASALTQEAAVSPASSVVPYNFEMCIPSSRVASGHRRLLSTWNAATEVETHAQ